VHNNVIAWDPVDRRGHLVLVTSLERVDNSQYLGGVTPGRGRVGENGADGLLGVNDEDGANCESDTLRVDVGGILVVDHVICQCDLPFLVANDWEAQVTAADLVDIVDPLTVAIDGVGRQADELDTSSCELWLEFGKCAELGGTDWGKVFRVGEEDNPFVADELVKVDRTLSGLGVKVGSSATQTESDTEVSTCANEQQRPADTYGSGRSVMLTACVGGEFYAL